MKDRELVLIVRRTEQGGLRCRHCHHLVEADPGGPSAWEVTALGGSLLCEVCAVKIATDYPGSFERA